MEQLDAVVFGEAMAMFIADEYLPLEEASHYTRALAGAEVNVAVGLSRLDYRIGWISRLGMDPHGHYVLNQLHQAGVDTTRVLFDTEHPTGFQLKSRVREGDPEVVYFRKGSAASYLAPNDEDFTYLRGARHLHLTGIPLALSDSCRQFAFLAIKHARAAGLSISFDPNLRPSLWKDKEEMRRVINEVALQADWFFPGLSEGSFLTGYTRMEDIAKFYLERGVKLVVLKEGEYGSSLFTPKQRYDAPAFSVQVVDTVGAGDGFAVGIISGMLDGLALSDCLMRANAIGALATTAQGDMEGLPDREQLHGFLQQRTQHLSTTQSVQDGESASTHSLPALVAGEERCHTLE
jgi:2-dehydro-3-deoxygluconokinase